MVRRGQIVRFEQFADTARVRDAMNPATGNAAQNPYPAPSSMSPASTPRLAGLTEDAVAVAPRPGTPVPARKLAGKYAPLVPKS